MSVSPVKERHPVAIARRAKKLTQLELATICGWPPGTQGHYEVGYIFPGPDRLGKMCEVLGLEPEKLRRDIQRWMKLRDKQIREAVA